MKVEVRKLTDEALMIEACESTFSGSSRQSLLSMYKSEHSPCRTQWFWIRLWGIPLSSATQLLRHTIGGAQPYQLTCRPDRNGGNVDMKSLCDKLESIHSTMIADNLPDDVFSECQAEFNDTLKFIEDKTDRNTPVNISLMWNAQSIINISKDRICLMAQDKTREIFQHIKNSIKEVDPDLAKMMVRKCVYRGGICGESKCCGFNRSSQFLLEMSGYMANFNSKQQPINYR